MRYILAFVGMLALATSAQADVPKLLHYQGYLQGVDGTPIHCPTLEECVIDDGVSMVFSLYASADSADALWSGT